MTQVDGCSDQFCLSADKPAVQGFKPRPHSRPRRTATPDESSPRAAEGRVLARLSTARPWEALSAPRRTGGNVLNFWRTGAVWTGAMRQESFQRYDV
jgi:hypothetical protein